MNVNVIIIEETRNERINGDGSLCPPSHYSHSISIFIDENGISSLPVLLG